MWALSNDVLITVLMSWLSMKDLVAFDAAVTNYRSRVRYLKCLREKECVSSHLHVSAREFSNACVNWMLRRSYKMKSIFINEGFLLSSVLELFAAWQEYLEDIDSAFISRELCEVLPELLSGCTRLKALRLGYSDDMADEELSAILTAVPAKSSLTSLVLSDTCGLSSNVVGIIGDLFPNLSSLSFDGQCDFTAPIQHGGSTPEAFKRLKELSINVSDVCHSTVVEFVLQRAVNLTSLAAGYGSVWNAAAKYCMNLECAVVSDSCNEIDNNSLQNLLSRNMRLSKLHLMNLNLGAKRWAALTDNCAMISDLYVHRCRSGDSSVLEKLAGAVRRMPALTSFKLDEMNVGPILEALQCCRGLERLELTPLDEVDDNNMISLVSVCTALKHISIHVPAPVTDDFLVTGVARCLSLLETLDLTRCVLFTDVGAIAVLSGCPYLRELYLLKAYRLTHRTLLHIATRTASLTSACLCGDNLTAMAIQSLSSGRHGLQVLGIYDTVTPGGLKLKSFREAIKLVREMRADLTFNGDYSW